ncbi:hypothetical protein [Halovenus marina]|uniref:hypothetical protein n=1 Tax=Halovenus marina TaxID=3396621 RepID=UPI003F5548E7
MAKSEQPDTVSHTCETGPVTVEKDPERREDGLLLRYTILSTADEPLEVVLEDSLPVEDYSKIGFHRAHQPNTWEETDDDTIRIEQSVDPNEECSLTLGIVFASEPSGAVSLSEQPQITHSRVTTERQDDGENSAGLLGRARETIFQDSDEAPDDDETERLSLTAPADDSAETTPARDGSTDGENVTEGDSSAANAGSDEQEEKTPESDEGTLNLTDPTDSDVTDRSDEDTETRPTEADDSTHSTEHDSDRTAMKDTSTDTDAGTNWHKNSPANLSLSDTKMAEAGGDTDGRSSEVSEDSGEATDERNRSVPKRSLVSELTEELTELDGSSDEAASLREALERTDMMHTAEAHSRTDQIRLHHVQARMDDFAAYVDLLEEFIDERGTPTEYADETDETLDSIAGDIGEMEDRLSELEAGQSSIRSNVQEIETAVEELTAELERAQESVEELTEDYGRELEDLSSQQADTEAAVEAMEERIETELADIQVRVETVEAFSSRLEEAFGATPEEEG